jgi:hypothetical protein
MLVVTVPDRVALVVPVPDMVGRVELVVVIGETCAGLYLTFLECLPNGIRLSA